MAKTEFKIGETFQCGLTKLRCEKAREEGYCTGCFLEENLDCDVRIVGNCAASCREDKQYIIFVKVEE